MKKKVEFTKKVGNFKCNYFVWLGVTIFLILTYLSDQSCKYLNKEYVIQRFVLSGRHSPATKRGKSTATEHCLLPERNFFCSQKEVASLLLLAL